MPRLNETELCYAGYVLKARDGDRDAARFLDNSFHNIPEEIREWRILSMDLGIRTDSPEDKRLGELNEKYECDQVFTWLANNW